MRTLSAVENAALLAPSGYSVSVRVRTVDAAGVAVDLTDYLGQDWVQSASVSDDVDSPVVGATVVLHRQAYRLAMSPLMTGSRINADGAFLRPNMPIAIDTRVGPLDADASAPWRPLFAGYVSEVAPDEKGVTLTCSDLAKRLVDTRIETMRSYGAPPPTGQALEAVLQAMIADAAGGVPWAASRPRVVGDVVRSAASTTHGYGYICTAAGTSGTSAPTWPTTLGATVTDGTAVWTCARTYPVLYVPDSPLWDLAPFDQGPEGLWDALQNLVAEIGWCLRYRYDDATSAWRLTLHAPERVGAVPVWTLRSSEYEALAGPAESDADVRNAVVVYYDDRADLDAAGNPKRKSAMRHDVASQLQWGRRWMALSEAATSNIDTAAEAGRLADAALADLSQPVYTCGVGAGLLPHLELGDVVLLMPDGEAHDQPLSAAIVSIQHTLTAPDDSGAAEYRTELGLRVAGPVSMSTGWLQREAQPGVAPTTPDAGPAVLTGVAAAPTIGGISVTYTVPTETDARKRARFFEAELHISQTPGFTPSAATLALVSSTSPMEVSGLAPAITYYVRLVARDSSGNRSEPSSQVSVTVSQVSGGDLAPGSVRTIHYLSPPTENLVPNGYSEAGAAAVGLSPEGDWLVEDPANALEGRWCRSSAAGDSEILTLVTGVPVRPGESLAAEVWAKLAAADPAAEVHLQIIWTDDDTEIGSSTLGSATGTLATSYSRVHGMATAPAGASRAALQVQHDTTATVFYDAISMRRAVKFDLLEANTIRTSNFLPAESDGSKGLAPGEMYAVSGAKLDNAGDALMVAADNLVVGEYRMTDLMFRLLNAIDGGQLAARGLWWRGNNDPDVAGGAPNIARFALSYQPARSYHSSALSIVGMRMTITPAAFSDNLDGMLYMAIEVWEVPGNQGPGGMPWTGPGAFLFGQHVMLPSRKYLSDSQAANVVTHDFNFIRAGLMTVNGSITRLCFRVQAWNLYGPSDFVWYYPNAGGTYSRTSGAVWGGGSGGETGGGGGGSGYCVDADTSILMGDGSMRRAGDVREGDLVLSRMPDEDHTQERMYRVSHASTHYAEERWRLVTADARELVASTGHRLQIGGTGGEWREIQDLLPGDTVTGAPGMDDAVVVRVEPASPGFVRLITVEGAHAYFSGGLYSHNAKPV